MPAENIWPKLLPVQPPSTNILDLSGSFSQEQLRSLEVRTISDGQSARVVILNEGLTQPQMEYLCTKVAQTWKMQDKFLLLIDLKSHSVMPYPNKAGHLFDQGYDQFFGPMAQDGNMYLAVRTALSRMRESGFGAHVQVNPSSAQESSAVNDHDDFWPIAGGLVGAFVIAFIVAFIIGRLPKKKLDVKKERLKFEALTIRLETLSRTKPFLYMTQVAAVGILGYIYIWIILLFLLLLTLCSVVLLIKLPILAVKAGLPLLALIAVILKSFWLKNEPVPGMYLTKEDYPEVFAFVEKVRQSIKAPSPHHIIINNEFNAAVLQKPRLGLLGWHKNYLMLGLPMLQAFSLEQFEAVLAHEMGHLAEKHSANVAWIYHLRCVYAQLMQELSANSSFGQVLFTSFLNWYFPFFDAYSFALRRTQEHYADQFAVDLVGKENAAAMLIGTDIKAAYFYKNYWKNIQKVGADTKTPPSNAFSLWQEAVNRDIKAEDAQIWLLESLNRKTNYDDSHPSPTDRLARILDIPASEVAEYARENLEKMLYVEKTAAQSLFVERTNEVFAHHDLEWQKEIAPVWEQNFEVFQEFKKELCELEEKEQKGEIKDEELLALAGQTARLKDFQTAKPIFLHALEKNPDNAELHQAYGEWLMDERDPDCQKHLEQAMKLERIRTFECCQLLYGWMASHNREDEADRYAETIVEWTADYQAFEKERSNLYPDDQFKEHGIPEEQISLLAETLIKFPEIKKAYMVEKVVKYFPERKLYVLVFEIKKPLFNSEAVVNDFFARLANSVSFPGNCLLIDMPKATPRLKQSLSTLGDTLLFER